MISGESYVIQSKIRSPETAVELINRNRLFDRIDSGLKKKITLVSGTAGSGKTSLLQAWMKNRGIQAAWYSLDDFDNDVFLFFEYICRSLEAVYGAFPESFGCFLTAAKNSQQPVKSIELTAAFISAIESIYTDFILILDDFHAVADLEIISSVRFLVNHMPGNLKVVILTRNDLPFPVSRLRQAGHMEEISNRDLNFTEAEISDYLELVAGHPPVTTDVEKIASATAGWGIAVGLAGLSYSAAGEKFIERIPDLSYQLSGYLLEEVVADLDGDFLFLLKIAAVPDRFCVELVEYLISYFKKFGIESPLSGTDFIERLISDTPFVSSHERETGYYKYHDFFREFLLHELKKESGRQRSQIESVVCDWYQRREIPEEALEYAFRSGSVEKITPLLEKFVKEHTDDRGLYRYESWLKDTGKFLDRPIPELDLHQARLNLYSGNIPEVLKHLSQADRGIEKKPAGPDSSRLKASSLIMKAVIAMYSGDIGRTADLCNNAMPLISEPKDRLYCMCKTYLGLSLLYSGESDINESIRLLDDAAESGKMSGDLILANSADFQRSLFTAISGNPDEALMQHENRIHDIESGNLPFYGILGNSYSEKARIKLESEEYTRCIDLADRGLEIAEESCSVTSIWWSLYTRALISCNCEANSSAEEWLNRLIGYEKENQILPQFKILSKTLQLDHLMDKGHPTGGALFSRYLRQENESPTYLQLPLLTAQARLLVLTGGKKKAEPLLYELHRFATVCGNAEIRLKTELLLGNRAEAEKTAAETGLLHTFHTYNRRNSDLPSKAQCISIEADDYAFREDLSERETEVIQLLSEGKSNMQIAEELFISMNTVKTHLKNINGKLGAENRTQAVHIARVSGLCRV